MAIKFRNFYSFQTGATAAGSTSYAETFSSINNTQLYSFLRGRGSPATNDFISVSMTTAPARLIFGRTGGTGSQVALCRIVPTTLVNPSMNGVAQFSQLTTVSQTVNCDLGPAVLIQGDGCLDESASPNGGNGYMIGLRGGGPTWQLTRASITSTILVDTTIAYAAGQVLRIEVTMPSAITYRVRVLINGIVRADTVDGAATRPTTGFGYPGIHANNVPVPNGSQCLVTDVSMGIL